MNNVYAATDSLPWVTVVGGGFGVVPIEGRKQINKITNYLLNVIVRAFVNVDAKVVACACCMDLVMSEYKI